MEAMSRWFSKVTPSSTTLVPDIVWGTGLSESPESRLVVRPFPSFHRVLDAVSARWAGRPTRTGLRPRRGTSHHIAKSSVVRTRSHQSCRRRNHPGTEQFSALRYLRSRASPVQLDMVNLTPRVPVSPVAARVARLRCAGVANKAWRSRQTLLCCRSCNLTRASKRRRDPALPVPLPWPLPASAHVCRPSHHVGFVGCAVAIKRPVARTTAAIAK